MFKFENAQNVTNRIKLNQEADIKLFAGNKLRLSDSLRSRLNWKINDDNILVLHDGVNFAIGCIPKSTKKGRPLNSKGEFSAEFLSDMLGGKDSEWVVTGEDFSHPEYGGTWVCILQTVKGEDVREELKEEIQEVSSYENVDGYENDDTDVTDTTEYNSGSY